MDVNMPPSTCAIIGGGISATANTCAAARKGRGAAGRKGGGYLIVLPRDLLDRLKAMRALARAYTRDASGMHLLFVFLGV